MTFVLVDLFAPGRIDGLNMDQVAGFANQVSFVGGTVLDDHDPFEVNPEILYPFLDRLLDARVKSLQPNFKTATVLVGSFELLLRRFDGPLGHIETVHEFTGEQLDVIGNGYSVSISLRESGPINILFQDQDDLGFDSAPAAGVSHAGLE